MKKSLLNNLLYINEHLTCNNYMTDIGIGWIYDELAPGEQLMYEFTQNNHLLFFIEGSCELTCNQFINREFKAGEIVLIPRMSAIAGKVVSNLVFVDMAFMVPLSGCDKLGLQAFNSLCEQITYDFKPLEIRYPLSEFLDLLIYCLRNGINCTHFHELKHKEVFFYFRGFYTKEELAELFYPLVAKSLDFKQFIYAKASECTSLAQLVELSGMSERSFYRKFVHEFNITPREWMQKQICQQIIQSITNPEIRINDIIDRFDFASPASFNRFCKRHFKLTPTQLFAKYRSTRE